jgi:hypothetical protein
VEMAVPVRGHRTGHQGDAQDGGQQDEKEGVRSVVRPATGSDNHRQGEAATDNPLRPSPLPPIRRGLPQVSQVPERAAQRFAIG